jgi:hypothetical protein
MLYATSTTRFAHHCPRVEGPEKAGQVWHTTMAPGVYREPALGYAVARQNKLENAVGRPNDTTPVICRPWFYAIRP